LSDVTFKVDLHLHTCASKDCATRPADVVQIAKTKGLDRICITDHNSIDGALAAQAIDPDFVIVGEEILTEFGGEILAFFVSEWIPPRLPHREIIERLKDQGAVISISHPFDRHRNRPWSEALLEEILTDIDAIETFNARAMHAEDNEKAKRFAAKHHLSATAGSDAHSGMEIGAAYVEMPAFGSAQEFRTGLKQATIHGQLSPVWVHLFSTVSKWRGKLGMKPAIG
jgi:predicted metal-dependent phosphoesterase TrpH